MVYTEANLKTLMRLLLCDTMTAQSPITSARRHAEIRCQSSLKLRNSVWVCPWSSSRQRLLYVYIYIIIYCICNLYNIHIYIHTIGDFTNKYWALTSLTLTCMCTHRKTQYQIADINNDVFFIFLEMAIKLQNKVGINVNTKKKNSDRCEQKHHYLSIIIWPS